MWVAIKLEWQINLISNLTLALKFSLIKFFVSSQFWVDLYGNSTLIFVNNDKWNVQKNGNLRKLYLILRVEILKGKPYPSLKLTKLTSNTAASIVPIVGKMTEGIMRTSLCFHIIYLFRKQIKVLQKGFRNVTRKLASPFLCVQWQSALVLVRPWSM